MDRSRKRPSRKYLRAYSALYGAAVPLDGFGAKTSPRASKAEIPTEHQEQVSLVKWAHAKRLPLVAIPNGAKRSLWEGARQKAAGLSAGLPDLLLLVPSRGYHAMFVELKRLKGGKVSNEQLYWINWLNANGYWAKVCHGAAEAIEAIEHYLAG